MAFNPNEHMMKLKGKDYLQVAWRLVWFREDHPDWGINAECIEQDQEHAIFKAVICDENGIQKSSGHGSESKRDFGDYLEKAETKAIGRALAMLGYGTQFAADELDEGERIVDSPINREKKQEQPKAEPVQATKVKSLKILMEKAMMAYGMEKAQERFEMLMKRAGCTKETMNEYYYDQIDAWIESDLKKGAA
jgi:hypothetical protein